MFAKLNSLYTATHQTCAQLKPEAPREEPLEELPKELPKSLSDLLSANLQKKKDLKEKYLAQKMDDLKNLENSYLEVVAGKICKVQNLPRD